MRPVTSFEPLGDEVDDVYVAEPIGASLEVSGEPLSHSILIGSGVVLIHVDDLRSIYWKANPTSALVR